MIGFASMYAGPIYLLGAIAVCSILVALVAATETRGDTWIVRLDDEVDELDAKVAILARERDTVPWEEAEFDDEDDQ